jgi:hypothetical protein
MSINRLLPIQEFNIRERGHNGLTRLVVERAELLNQVSLKMDDYNTVIYEVSGAEITTGAVLNITNTLCSIIYCGKFGDENLVPSNLVSFIVDKYGINEETDNERIIAVFGKSEGDILISSFDVKLMTRHPFLNDTLSGKMGEYKALKNLYDMTGNQLSYPNVLSTDGKSYSTLLKFCRFYRPENEDNYERPAVEVSRRHVEIMKEEISKWVCKEDADEALEQYAYEELCLVRKRELALVAKASLPTLQIVESAMATYGNSPKTNSSPPTKRGRPLGSKNKPKTMSSPDK